MKYVKLPVFYTMAAPLLAAMVLSVTSDILRNRDVSQLTIRIGELGDRLARWMWPNDPLPEPFGIVKLRIQAHQ